jgi:signal-induced proliferation-associated 1 like protein 3
VPLAPVAPIAPVEPLLLVPVAPMDPVVPVVPVPVASIEPLVVLLVPIEPLVLEPVMPLVLLEPLLRSWPPIGLPVSAALLVPVLLWSAPFCCCELPVALADELPLLWSFMLELALVPAPRVFWVPSLDCAWTVVAPNMAAATEAPSRPFSSLFIFMSIS